MNRKILTTFFTFAAFVTVFNINVHASEHATDSLDQDWGKKEIAYKTENHEGFICNHHKIINTKAAHQNGIYGKGIKIGIIDCGWFNCQGDTKKQLTKSTIERLANLQLNENENEKEGDLWGHSNLVASIIAGKHGIAPQAELEVFSAPYDSEGQNFVDWTVDAIKQAITAKVDFINMSIGWGKQDEQFPEELKKALYAARDAGIGVLIAASNDNSKEEKVALGKNMYIGIGEFLKEMNGYARMVVATKYTDGGWGREEHWEDSNSLFGPIIQNYGNAAPGKDILSCGANCEEVVWSGTSAATPIITAVAALAKCNFRNLNNADILNIVANSSRKTPLYFLKNVDVKIKRGAYKNLENSFNSGKTLKEKFVWSRQRNYAVTGKNYENFKQYVCEKVGPLNPYNFGQGVVDIQNVLNTEIKEK